MMECLASIFHGVTNDGVFGKYIPCTGREVNSIETLLELSNEIRSDALPVTTAHFSGI